jgi:DNA polymerase-3 subunit delta'
LPVEVVQRELESGGLETHGAKLIAHISGGRFGYALQLLEDGSLLEKREEQLDDLHRLIAASRVQKFAYADKLARDKDSMRHTILIWLSYWRDVMLRAAQATMPLINVDRNVEIEDLAERINLASARDIVKGLETALAQMDRNVNSRLLAEVLLLDLPQM